MTIASEKVAAAPLVGAGQTALHSHLPLDAWPVGSVFIAVVATNPNTLLGGGTWAAFGTGKVLVGIDTGDADFNTAEGTGGAKTHGHTDNLSHAGMAVANHVFTQAAAHAAHVFTQATAHVFTQAAGHAAHVFTQPSAHAAHASLATHSHELPFIKVAGSTGVLRMLASSIFGTGTSRAPESVSAAPTANTTAAAVELSQAVSGGTPDAHSAHAGGAVDAHSAHSGAGVDAHSGSGVDAHSAHSGAGVDAHGVTQPSAHGAHAAVSHLMSYIVVYMWKRTA